MYSDTENYYDGQGHLRSPGESFRDYEGHWCDPGRDDFRDRRGHLCSPRDDFYDGQGHLCSPQDDFYDGKGFLRAGRRRGADEGLGFLAVLFGLASAAVLEERARREKGGEPDDGSPATDRPPEGG
ncbi:hypothetical protein [Actinospica robiniae]|uniref:hypothetical protein n=1 Tax=Actinospica robiniae TaxID=304901 RepID=UPI0003FC46A0|nr:hypothetical protein [Actinospica robiniae]